MPKYVPEKGDFVRLSFDPQSGYEQKGRRMSCFGRKRHLIQHPNSTLVNFEIKETHFL